MLFIIYFSFQSVKYLIKINEKVGEDDDEIKILQVIYPIYSKPVNRMVCL
jgi:hypothetical protein